MGNLFAKPKVVKPEEAIAETTVPDVAPTVCESTPEATTVAKVESEVVTLSKVEPEVAVTANKLQEKIGEQLNVISTELMDKVITPVSAELSNNVTKPATELFESANDKTKHLISEVATLTATNNFVQSAMNTIEVVAENVTDTVSENVNKCTTAVGNVVVPESVVAVETSAVDATLSAINKVGEFLPEQKKETFAEIVAHSEQNVEEAAPVEETEIKEVEETETEKVEETETKEVDTLLDPLLQHTEQLFEKLETEVSNVVSKSVDELAKLPEITCNADWIPATVVEEDVEVKMITETSKTPETQETQETQETASDAVVEEIKESEKATEAEIDAAVAAVAAAADDSTTSEESTSSPVVDSSSASEHEVHNDNTPKIIEQLGSLTLA